MKISDYIDSLSKRNRRRTKKEKRKYLNKYGSSKI